MLSFFQELTPVTPIIGDVKSINCKKIDAAAVKGNRMVKLKGTMGQTIVIPHRYSSLLAVAVSELQKNLIDQLGEAKQTTDAKNFVDEKENPNGSANFAPIKNLHTTITALRVIDAIDEKEWNLNLILSYLLGKLAQKQKLFQPELYKSLYDSINDGNFKCILDAANLEQSQLILDTKEKNLKTFIVKESKYAPIDEGLEAKLIQSIQEQPPLQLEIDYISLSSSGKLAIVWKTNADLVALRLELAKIGGVLKSDPALTITNIGYFPNCLPGDLPTIQAALIIAMKKFNLALNNHYIAPKINSEKNTKSYVFNINLNDIQLVKFARNDLHPDFCSMTRLVRDNKFSKEYYDTSFPFHLTKSAVSSEEREGAKDLIDGCSLPRIALK